MNSSHQGWSKKEVKLGSPEGNQHPDIRLTMNVREEQVNHIRYMRRSSHVYRSLPTGVGVLQVGPGRQELHYIPVALLDGNVDG